MNWKYTAGSAGAALVTMVASWVTQVPGVQPAAPAPAALDVPAPIVDVSAEAERLEAALARASAYRGAARDAFRFGGSARPADVHVEDDLDDVPRETEAPAVPEAPFSLAGMAIDVVDGVEQRTAILSSWRGVDLVKEQEVIAGAWRVVTIGPDFVTIEATADASRITLRLAEAP